MSNKTEGVVAVIMESKFKPNEWRLKFDGVEQWFSLSKRYEGVVEQGNTIGIKYETAGTRHQVEGVKLIAKGSAAANAQSDTAGKADYWAEKAKHDAAAIPRIGYANARDHALRMVDLQLRNGGLVLPRKAADVTGAIDGYVDLYTASFFADSVDQGAVARMAKELDADDKPPEDPEPTIAEERAAEQEAYIEDSDIDADIVKKPRRKKL